MPKKIEILENTLLKLLVRRGSDVDRQQVVLSEGELGYTTDTERLYVGDNQNPGGNVVGNLFKGSVADITTLANVVSGDLAYSTSTSKLYRLKYSDSSNLANWEEIGGVYSATNNSIVITGNNTIGVGTLSAGNFSLNALGNSLELDSNNKISLSSTNIKTNSVSTYDSSYLKLPAGLSINSIDYNWPTGGVGSELVLTTDINGNLEWKPSLVNTTLFVTGTAGQIPVGTIMPFVSAANAPTGWLLCNGQLVLGSAYPYLSAVIKTTFGGSGASFNVPNLINKTIYGVSSDPGSSTVYSLCARTANIGTLSATGMLYIIKAVPDRIVQSTFTVTNGLTATVNGAPFTGSAVSTLSGNLAVGLPIMGEGGVVRSKTEDFAYDIYGRVTGTVTGSYTNAGAITALAPQNTEFINQTSPIVFFKNPVTIYNRVVGAVSDQRYSFSTAVTAYPYITGLTQTGFTTVSVLSVTPAASVPYNAKNLIVETYMLKDAWSSPSIGIIAAAPNASLLGSINSLPTDNEYGLATCWAQGAYDHQTTTTQTFIPLSADSANRLVFGLRMSENHMFTAKIRIVGYTL
jgi:microcystin-dependent protein